MMLKEITAIASEALPLAEFRDHLRLGTGFADVGAEDVALEAYLRAAIAAIEGRTSKVLLSRDFLLALDDWRGDAAQPLPVSPVSIVGGVTMIARDETRDVVDPSRYQLVRDMARPRLASATGLLPGIPVGGRVEIAFTAGFGASWSEVPVDLAQAVFLLASQYFEQRHDNVGDAGAMPFGVMALIERWRTVRVIGGRS